MDELDALRRMRTALAEQEHPDRIALRTNWRAAADARPRRRGLTISLAATAAVLAGAIAAMSLPPDGPDPQQARSPVPQGGNVLLVAAGNAQKAPSGKYWHYKRISGEIYAVGKSRADHYKVDSRQGGEGWTDRAGKGMSRHLDYTDVPLTAEDRRKWEAAGAPTRAPIPDPEGTGAQSFLDMGGTMPGRGWEPSLDDYSGLTAVRVAALPTDPEALERELLGLKGNWRAVSTGGGQEPIRALKGRERVRALSEVTKTLLSTAPASPAVRAAAFRMLAAQPGVKSEGTATDPLGRTGSAVSLPLETTAPLGLYTAPKRLATYRRQLIIDPSAGTLLAVRDLVVKPPRGSLPLPPGDSGRPRRLRAADMPDRFHRPGEVAAYEVFEITGWTDIVPHG